MDVTGERSSGPLVADFVRHVVGAGGPRTWVTMLTSVDGRVVGPDGLSGSLGTKADQDVLLSLRASAHAVVLGRGTAEAERYVPLRPHGSQPAPALVVVSETGSVPYRLLERIEGRGVVGLATCEAAGSEAIALAEEELGASAVHVSPGRTVSLPSLLTWIRATFGPRIQCEGGPHLAGSLLSSNLIDDLVIAVSPTLTGSGMGLFEGLSTGQSLELAHSQGVGDTLFGLWRVRR